MQDAGIVRPLATGQECDVPEVLAQQWIRDGKAVAVEDAAVPAAPENKAAKRSRARR
jgi:hypothetical protein